MTRLLPLILAVALVASACGDDSNPTDVGGPGEPTTTAPDPTTPTTPTTPTPDPTTPEGALAAARQRWAENGLVSYRLTTSEICFCDVIEWVNTVVDGTVTGHEPVKEGTLYDPGPRSMETLFDEIEAAIAEGYAMLDVEYHPETGAVVRYYVDVEENVADEEYGVSVISLVPYDPAAPKVEIAAAALVDDYGCGYGFAKGDAGQNLALLIHWNGGFDPEGPDLSAPIALPDDDWDAIVQVGSDLFANWCDDVLEPGEPTPAVNETWALVDGTLTASEVDADAAGGSAFTATLSGAVAESPDGEQVPLDAIELWNSCYGCFAG